MDYIVKHVNTALDADHAIVHQLDLAPDSRTGKPVHTEIWFQPGNDTSRSITLDDSGNPVMGYLVTDTPTAITSIEIDYRARTWSRHV